MAGGAGTNQGASPGRRDPWQAARPGVLLFVRVTPKAARDEIAGVAAGADGPHLAVKVRAVPDKGAANAAVEKLIAHWLGVAASAVSVRSGSKSRLKQIAVAGDGQELARRLAERIAELR